MLTASQAIEPTTEPTTATPLAPSASGWGYRPQLDGLRAVAVYLVVAYHAGSWRLQGGFVGVDLFFVLSGFLVTKVILGDVAKHGRLRLRVFYARRMRRLIPAATLAIVGTTLVALLLSAPVDRASWVGDARAASLWFANWHFIGKANDYFRSDDATSPFQHFWSLSVEEQFYLAFPLVLLATWRLLGRNLPRTIWATALALAVGIGHQITSAADDANRAYLGTDTRAYQLLVGVLLALILWHRPVPERWVRWAPAVSTIALVGFIAVGTSALQVTPSTRGLAAAAASGVLVASVQATSSGVVHRVLSSPPLRYLGQISYGTYLWHWPILVLTLQVVDASPKALLVIAMAGGTALAALSHALVEHPIRSSPRLERMPRTAIVGGLCAAILGGLIVAPSVLWSERKPSISAAAAHNAVNGPSQPVPSVDWEEARLAPPGAPSCWKPDGSDCVVVEGSAGTILLIGDSHARTLMPALSQLAADRDLQLSMAYSTACPWMHESIPVMETAGKARCVEKRALLYGQQLAAIDPNIIIVAQFPYTQLSGGLTSTDPVTAGMPMPAIMEHQIRSSTELLLRGDRRLVLVEPTPTFDQNILACLSRADDAQQCTFSPNLSGPEREMIRALASADPRISSVDLDPLVCPRLPICDPLQHGYPVWRDSNHLTTRFATHLSPLLERELELLGVFDEAG